MTDMLAKGSLFTHQADTQQYKHLILYIEFVFVATCTNLNPELPLF